MLYGMSSRVLSDVARKSLVTATDDLFIIIEGRFMKQCYKGKVIKSNKPSLCVPSNCRSLCCEFFFFSSRTHFHSHQGGLHP